MCRPRPLSQTRASSSRTCRSRTSGVAAGPARRAGPCAACRLRWHTRKHTRRQRSARAVDRAACPRLSSMGRTAAVHRAARRARSLPGRESSHSPAEPAAARRRCRALTSDHFGVLALPVAEFLAVEHHTAYIGYSVHGSDHARHPFFASTNRPGGPRQGEPMLGMEAFPHAPSVRLIRRLLFCAPGRTGACGLPRRAVPAPAQAGACAASPRAGAAPWRAPVQRSLRWALSAPGRLPGLPGASPFLLLNPPPPETPARPPLLQATCACSRCTRTHCSGSCCTR
jgi:hypothetical protein